VVTSLSMLSCCTHSSAATNRYLIEETMTSSGAMIRLEAATEVCSRRLEIRDIGESLCNELSPDMNSLIFFICLVGGGIKVHSTLRPLLCQPRVIMIMKKSVESLAGETEVLGENLSQCRFVHNKPHMLPVRKPGPPRWEANV
jgi:hypothetical protein